MSEHLDPDPTPALVVRVIGLHPAGDETPPAVLFEEPLSEDARQRAIDASADARREYPDYDMVLVVVEPATAQAAAATESPAVAEINEKAYVADQIGVHEDVADMADATFVRCRDCSNILTTANSGTVDAEGVSESPGAKICHSCAGVRYANATQRRADHIVSCPACQAGRTCAIADELADLCGLFAGASSEHEAA
jgi:hypothetical protein